MNVELETVFLNIEFSILSQKINIARIW